MNYELREAMIILLRVTFRKCLNFSSLKDFAFFHEQSHQPQRHE